VELPGRRAEALRLIVENQHMLHEVVAWMATGRPAPQLLKVVEQDEYTNDVVLTLDDLWLVYDCS